MYISEELEEYEWKSNENREKLLKSWKESWEKAIALDKDCKDREDLFKETFSTIYELTCIKAQKNKHWNFFWKTFFLCLIAGISICYVACIIYSLKNTGILNPNLDVFLNYTILFIPIVILLKLIPNWIGVKKYQETWVRHSKHQYLMEQEMMRYIYGLGDYAEKNRKQKFIENVLEIWAGNQSKFATNMEKEEKLIDILTDFDKLKQK